jgi:hypothetical protein
LKLKAILILVAILAVAGTTYYFVTRPKAVTQPDAKHFVWNFDMDELQNVTFILPKTINPETKLPLTESFDKHPDNEEFYFDVVNGPEVDNQRWGGGIPALLSGPQANRMILQSATESQLQQYGLDPAIKPLNMDIKLTILVSGTPVQYEIYVGDSNPDGSNYYVRLANNTDVYTVDKSWYDVLADIITNPPYIPAALAIDTPTVSSPAVAVGATETVSVNITNNGDVIGAFNINLLIGGNLVNTQAITLGPRASQVVTFQVVESTAGKYVASINQTHNVSFTVQ